MARLLFLLCALLLTCAPTSARTEHSVHFENTDHELHVYEIYGKEPGKTLLIIGGMHNEPGGYVTADLFADIRLKKGNLIVVPRANMPAIVNNKRGINNDMNRTFSPKGHQDNHKHIYEDDIVSVLKVLIAKSDALLNLHDGYGYYRPAFESDLFNPKRWGQAIIVDRDQFQPKNGGAPLMLAQRAQRVVNQVNELIDDPIHRFHYKNTRTKSPDSFHKEQRHSATFYALYEHGIESYGIETSKNIRSLNLKVSYQTMIVNAFLDEYDIIPERNVQELAEPQLSYLLVSINEGRPVAYKDGEVINVKKGDRVRVEQAFTNYQRGVVVDIEKSGQLNDMGKPYTVSSETAIRVFKDQYLAGRLLIRTSDDPDTLSTPTTVQTPTTEAPHLVVEVNGEVQQIEHGKTVTIGPDDTLRLIRYHNAYIDDSALKINFIGFVGNPQTNDAEDRGYPISPAQLIKRFSVNGQGKRYRIKAEQHNQQIAQFYVDIRG